VVKGEQLT